MDCFRGEGRRDRASPPAGSESVTCLAACGDVVVSGADDGELRVWDLGARACRCRRRRRGPVSQCTYTGSQGGREGERDRQTDRQTETETETESGACVRACVRVCVCVPCEERGA